MSSSLHPRTRAVHAGTRRSQYGEMAEALFLTQGFAYDSAEQAEGRFQQSGPDEFIYARYGIPTSRMFEDRMASLEGTEDAFATASGMAAVNGALMALVKPGDRVIAARQLFGSCLYVLDILARFGVDVTLVDGTKLAEWDAAVTPGTRAVFFESVSNPVLEVMDIAGIARIAHAAGAVVVIDNVFATPVFSRAAAQGADVIIYSTTKHVDGGGRCLGGVICGTRQFVREVAEPYLKHTGGAISPFNAWIMLNGLTTMDLRVRAMADSALAGTRWVLDTLVDGETASSVLGDARLELAPDGTLAASTGCRSIGGSWRTDGDALVLDAAYDSVGCTPPADRQDEHVLGVFAARPVVTIDGNRLTLTAADGRALGYRVG